MGEYTVSLRYLIERGYPLALDRYPIFDESYRNYLNKKIIDHFYFREIGQETPDRFNFFLARKMNEIMPYYNQIYESTLIDYDPLATEFFKEGTHTERKREYEGNAKKRSKRGETTGEVFSSNEDTKHNEIFGQVSKEGNVGSYSKQGDKNVDTVNKKIEDFNEDKTSKTTEDFNQDKVSKETQALSEDKGSKKTEDFTENREGNVLTTTDMHTKTVSESDSTGTKKTNTSQTTVFSDLPQAGMTQSTTIKPDGTIVKTQTGYATTTTDVAGTENTTTTDHTTTTTNTDNTGTVNADSTEKITNDNTTNVTENKTNDNVIDVTENIKNDNVTDFTGNTQNDNVTDFTQNEKTTWHESGNHTEDTDYKNDTNTDVTYNAKNDSERNTAVSGNSSSLRKETSKTGENVSETFTGKGRKGVSAADLILKYRSTLINVDMMVIEELETLFMGVY